MHDEWLEDCLTDGPPDGVKSACVARVSSRHSSDESKENNCKMKPSKPHSTPQTLKWLDENYEIAEGVCIPRSTLYVHYLDYCERNSCQPVNAASFGKIIRQQFPHITTRRLGTRGQSKYHYYGIGVKETSAYYDVTFSRKGIQITDGKKEQVKQVIAYSPRSKLGTLLPEFPSVQGLDLPSNVTEENASTFLMMYRTHCQRILDTVIRANFDEVQSFLIHFWQGMPQHIVPVLGTPFIVNLVGVCDSILYKTISGVLMPTVLQALPDSLTQVIRKFARQFDEWLRSALEELPPLLQQMKCDLARRFSQVLKRQTSLNHLCQATRTVMQSGDIISQMLEDWSHVDLTSIVKQTLYTMDQYHEADYHLIVNLYHEFEGLLQEQAPLEAYTEWLEAMVERCVVRPASRKLGSLRRRARQFLLMWSCFGTRVIRDMTLHSAPSFGSFHLLHLMFDDFVLYLVECLHSQEKTRDLMAAVKGERSPGKMAEIGEDILSLPNIRRRSNDFVPAQIANAMTLEGSPDRQSVITETPDTYASAAMYSTAASPRSVPSSQASSSSPAYGVRCSESSRSEVSPPCVNQSCADSPHPAPSTGGAGASHYSGIYDSVPAMTAPCETAYSGHYDFGNIQSQCNYGGLREYRYNRSGIEWPEQRFPQVPADQGVPSGHGADYSSYTRDACYDSMVYSYDASSYAADATRTSQSENGTAYFYDNSGPHYSSCDNTLPESKKQKLCADVSNNLYSKKSSALDTYSFGMAGEQNLFHKT